MFLLPLLSGLLLVNAQATSGPDVNTATAGTLLYFYPIVQYARTFGTLLDTTGSNAFFHQDAATNVTSQTVTRANIDTVYSLAPIDLSASDVVFTIPKIVGNRSHVFPFHDYYGNNFATLGSFNNASEGRWLLRLGEPGQTAIEINSGSCSEYTGFVNFPTTYGGLFPRLLVLNQPSDSVAIRNIQSQMKLETVARGTQGLGKRFPKLTTDLIDVEGLTPASYVSPAGFNTANVSLLLNVVGRTVLYNLPVSHTIDNQQVLQNLSVAGVGIDGSYRAPDRLNMTTVNAIMQSELTASLADPSNFGSAPPYWRWPAVIGDFGYSYIFRAQINYQGYLGITSDQVEYPTYSGGVTIPGGAAKSAISLPSNTSAIMRFSSKPPVAGFWSVTVYNSTGLLLPNELDRYGLGDRNNLTYPGGELVYGQASNHPDDSFELLFQSQSIPPPANWTSNWLPTPANGEYFFLNLRFYGPTSRLTDGSWSYPNITKQAAISS